MTKKYELVQLYFGGENFNTSIKVVILLAIVKAGVKAGFSGSLPVFAKIVLKSMRLPRQYNIISWHESIKLTGRKFQVGLRVEVAAVWRTRQGSLWGGDPRYKDKQTLITWANYNSRAKGQNICTSFDRSFDLLV